MQRTPIGGDTVYEWIAPSAEDGVTDTEWVYLQGSYSFSGEAAELLLYVESPDSELVDFYIDDITSATQITPGGYIIELAITLDAITPQEGMLIGFDFQVNNDEDGDGARDSVVTWNDPTHQSYQNTSRLGLLQFAKLAE